MLLALSIFPAGFLALGVFIECLEGKFGGLRVKRFEEAFGFRLVWGGKGWCEFGRREFGFVPWLDVVGHLSTSARSSSKRKAAASLSSSSFRAFVVIFQSTLVTPLCCANLKLEIALHPSQ